MGANAMLSTPVILTPDFGGRTSLDASGLIALTRLLGTRACEKARMRRLRLELCGTSFVRRGGLRMTVSESRLFAMDK